MTQVADGVHRVSSGVSNWYLVEDGGAFVAVDRDSEMALASLAKLEELPAETVLPGHGEPWTRGVGEAVRLAREAGPS